MLGKFPKFLLIAGVILILLILLNWEGVIDLTKSWLAAVTQLILEIKPAPVEEEVVPAPFVAGPVIEEEIPPEKIVEEEVPPVEEIPPEKIVEIPPIIAIPPKDIVIKWPTYGAVDVVTGISGLVSWSISALTQKIPVLPQTTDTTPTFSGVTSIPFALIYLEVHQPLVTGQTQADEAGFWTWTCPKPLSTGIHVLHITAQDPKDPSIKITSVQKFEVITEWEKKKKEKTLFDLTLTIEAEYKKVYPGDALLVKVDITKFEPVGRIDLPLHYQIRDEADEIILDHTETMAIETRLSFLKTFHISPEAKIGKYRVYLEIPYNRTFVSSSDSFEIVKPPLFIIPGKVILTPAEIIKGLSWLFAILALCLITFFFALYREYKRTKEIERISPHDLRDRGGTFRI